MNFSPPDNFCEDTRDQNSRWAPSQVRMLVARAHDDVIDGGDGGATALLVLDARPADLRALAAAPLVVPVVANDHHWVTETGSPEPNYCNEYTTKWVKTFWNQVVVLITDITKAQSKKVSLIVYISAKRIWFTYLFWVIHFQTDTYTSIFLSNLNYISF